MALSREKKALGLLAVLLAFACACIAVFIVVGHGWNVTAAHIDDAVGEMDGYTVILFDGMGETSVSPTLAEDEGGLSLGQILGTDNSTEGNAKSSDYLEQDGDTVAQGVEVLARDAEEAANQPLIESAKRSYKEKGAQVFTVDLDNLEKYREGVIAQKNGVRIGIMSAFMTSSKKDVKSMVSYFREHGVQFVVCLTENKKYAHSTRGINLVISTAPSSSSMLEITSKKGIFWANTPATGAVGAAIVNSSKVVAANTVTP